MKPNKRSTIIAVTGAVALLLSGATAAVEPAPSIAKMVKACTACHGDGGVSTNPDTPTIAGISMFVHADYLAAYRDGARTCTEETKMMCNLTKRLTDEQTEAFGEYFSSLPFKPAAQEFDPELAVRGQQVHEENCGKCHTDGGSNPEDEASILAGQWMPYLRASLKSFIAGEREQPEKMKPKTENLTAEDCEALVHYYASQQ